MPSFHDLGIRTVPLAVINCPQRNLSLQLQHAVDIDIRGWSMQGGAVRFLNMSVFEIMTILAFDACLDSIGWMSGLDERLILLHEDLDPLRDRFRYCSGNPELLCLEILAPAMSPDELMLVTYAHFQHYMNVHYGIWFDCGWHRKKFNCLERITNSNAFETVEEGGSAMVDLIMRLNDLLDEPFPIINKTGYHGYINFEINDQCLEDLIIKMNEYGMELNWKNEKHMHIELEPWDSTYNLLCKAEQSMYTVYMRQ